MKVLKGYIHRGGSRAAATSKMDPFVIIVNGWKPLTIITKRSILNVAAAVNQLLIHLVADSVLCLENYQPVRKYHVLFLSINICMSTDFPF